MEASCVTGPAKNLIEFARRAAQIQPPLLRACITIATFQRGKSPTANEFVLACQLAGVEMAIIPERFAFDPTVIPAIRKLANSCNPQIIQSHAVKSHFLVRLAGLHRGRCWIAFHHGYTFTDMKVRIYNRLDRWSLPAASRVVTVCHPFVSTLVSAGVRPERITVQHNSVGAFLPSDGDTVLRLRHTLGLPPDARVLLVVGRLSYEKGQADLIEALSILRREDARRQLRLIIVGEGPDREHLKAGAKKAGVADWVIFAGHHADVSPYYTMSDLVVLPSHTEGSPNTLLEAMAAGLPIVATAVGGVPEIVTTEKEAILVEKQSPNGLAFAIDRVLKDADLRRRTSEGARKAAGFYSPGFYCSSMLSLYRVCLAGDAGANQDDYQK